MSSNDSYPYQTDEAIDRDELLDSFSLDVTLNNSNQNCLLKTKSFQFENFKKLNSRLPKYKFS